MNQLRLIEWFFAFVFLAIAFVLFLPVKTMSPPLFHFHLSLLSEHGWALLFFAVGGLRIAALIINGMAPRGSPAIRCTMAGISAVVFATLAAAFAGTGPLGWWAASVYAVSTAFEFVTVYRSIQDVSHAVDHCRPA
jgi:hypothetical protein